MGKRTVNYDKVIEAVESGKYTSYMACGKACGVSDQTVKRVCKMFNIALPEKEEALAQKDFEDWAKWEQWFSREWRLAVERITSA